MRHWEPCNVFIQLFLRIKVLKLHAHITIFSLPSLSHMEREGTKRWRKKEEEESSVHPVSMLQPLRVR